MPYNATFFSLQGAADKNVTLMKEAHRSEVEALHSKVFSLTETVNDLQSKQKTLVVDHQKELELAETMKNEEINKLRERMNSNEVSEPGGIYCDWIKEHLNYYERQGLCLNLFFYVSFQTEHGNLIKECETIKSEKNKTAEELLRLQHEHNTLQYNHNTTSQKVKELEAKCEELSEAVLGITAERNDAIQV
jgi:uncharacterized protein YlxW (UPF0749 family)